jgi:hypothetical protein
MSNLYPPGTCPVGYTFYTDLDGNSLCCGSPNINIFDRSCSAKGKEGVCAFVPGIVDTRDNSNGSKTYPMCHEISAENQLRESGSLCPARYKYHVTSGNSTKEVSLIDLAGGMDNYQKLYSEGANKFRNLSPLLAHMCSKFNAVVASEGGVGKHPMCRVNAPAYKCCSSHVNPGAVDCNSGSKFCTGLTQGQNIFNTPASCENMILLDSIECPDNTNMIASFNLPKVANSSAPICVGAKGNCMPRKVIETAQKAGLFKDIDINTNIMNCEVYDMYHNVRSLSNSQVETKISKDL